MKIVNAQLLTLALLGLATLLPMARAREIVAVSTEFSKVFEQRSKGVFVGLGVDVVRALALHNGDTVRFEIYPWARAQMLVETGQADALVGPYKSPERTLRFAFAEHPFFQDQLRLYGRKGRPIVWNGELNTLKSRRIVSVFGWTYGDAFDQLDTIKVYSLNDAVLMLSREHVDLLAANSRDMDGQLQSSPATVVESLYPLDPAISVQNGYLAYPKRPSHDALRVQWDHAMRAMTAKGDLAKLAQKYKLKTP